MTKKDFSSVKTGDIMATIQQGVSTQGMQTIASQEEQAQRAAELRTQGRRGCKALRINMAFTPANHQFLKVMAKASGKTMTEFCNLVIAAYQNEHPELMAQAEAFLQTINSGLFSSLFEKAEDPTQE